MISRQQENLEWYFLSILSIRKEFRVWMKGEFEGVPLFRHCLANDHNSPFEMSTQTGFL